MKKIPLLLSAVAIVFSLFAFYLTKSSTELVYVDVNKLVEGYKRTKEIRSDFEKKSAAMKSNVDTLVANWQKEITAYEKERASYSAKELKLKQELLGTKQQQLNNYQQGMEKQLQEEDKKTMQTIINDINDYIKEYGKIHKYKIIFGASGSGTIMYADESTDLTDKVLKGLNEKYIKR